MIKIENAKRQAEIQYVQALIDNHKNPGVCHRIEMTENFEVFTSIFPSSNSWTQNCTTLAIIENTDLFDRTEFKKFGEDKVIAYGTAAEDETENGREATAREKEEAGLEEHELVIILDDSYDETLEIIAENLDLQDIFMEMHEIIEGDEN